MYIHHRDNGGTNGIQALDTKAGQITHLGPQDIYQVYQVLFATNLHSSRITNANRTTSQGYHDTPILHDPPPTTPH